jgi:hypothetical protein
MGGRRARADNIVVRPTVPEETPPLCLLFNKLTNHKTPVTRQSETKGEGVMKGRILEPPIKIIKAARVK